MPTTYEHGSWLVTNTQSITEYVVEALGEFVDDYLVTAIVVELMAEINKALPDHAQLCGNILYSAQREKDYDLEEIVEAIDLFAIAANHAVIGEWNAYDGDIQTNSIQSYIDSCLTGREEDYDVESIVSDLENEVDGRLPIEMDLCDNRIYGPEGTEPPNLNDIIKTIDLEDLFEEHRYGDEEEYDDYDDGDYY